VELLVQARVAHWLALLSGLVSATLGAVGSIRTFHGSVGSLFRELFHVLILLLIVLVSMWAVALFLLELLQVGPLVRILEHKPVVRREMRLLALVLAQPVELMVVMVFDV
jgi:hypothetical protein